MSTRRAKIEISFFAVAHSNDNCHQSSRFMTRRRHYVWFHEAWLNTACLAEGAVQKTGARVLGIDNQSDDIVESMTGDAFFKFPSASNINLIITGNKKKIEK